MEVYEPMVLHMKHKRTLKKVTMMDERENDTCTPTSM